ncbi:MAG TPA: hypothetical protein VNZ55_09395 [Thermomicrobiales bacterium]|nr:hypothetical protein [Thermomicrobiales bacterium]
MRSSFAKLRVFAILAMTVGLLVGTNLPASAAQTPDEDVIQYCIGLYGAGIIDEDGLVDPSYTSLEDFVENSGIADLLPGVLDVVDVYNGGCFGFGPGPGAEPGVPPTSVPLPTAQPTDPFVPGDTSSVTISGYLSDQVSVPTFMFSFPFSTADVGGTIPAEFTFELYVNGDTSAAPFAVVSTAGGAAVVDGVPTGLVTIYETGSGASVDVLVISGNITSVNFFMPSGPNAGESDINSIAIDTYVCDQIRYPVSSAGSTFFGGAAVEENDLPSAGCTPTDRDLVLYLNGDLTAQPWASFTTYGGVAVLNAVPEGDHVLVDPATGYQFGVSVFSDEGGNGTVTAISLFFPVGGDVVVPTEVPAEPTATAAPGQPTAVPGGDHGHHGHDHGKKDSGKKGSSSSSSSSTVSSLPNTGQGSSSSSDSSTLVLLFGAMSLVALAGGVAWRQRRSA